MLPARDVCAKRFASTPGSSLHHHGVHRVGRSGRAGRTRADSRRAAAGVRSNCSFCASRSVTNMTGSPPEATRLLGQSDDRERVAPELDLLTEREPRAAVGDRLVAAAQDRPAFDHERRFAGPRDLRADDQQALGLAAMLRFDVLIGDAAGRGDAPLRGDGLARVAGKPRASANGPRVSPSTTQTCAPAARTSPSDSTIRPR